MKDACKSFIRLGSARHFAFQYLHGYKTSIRLVYRNQTISSSNVSRIYSEKDIHPFHLLISEEPTIVAVLI